jgi:DNA-binding NarL/FixJ family response regulator
MVLEVNVMTAVLIVDDNAFVRTALSEFFAREPDFEVCGLAENGREAIEEANRLHPDLIVLDLTMPVMNGLEAARILNDLMPAVPLIMYSSFPDESSAKIAKSVGISALVSKSERVSVLIEKARGLIHPKAA